MEVVLKEIDDKRIKFGEIIDSDGTKWLVRLDTMQAYQDYTGLKIASDKESKVLVYVCVGVNSQYSIASHYTDYRCLCSNHPENRRVQSVAVIGAGSDEASWQKFWDEDMPS